MTHTEQPDLIAWQTGRAHGQLPLVPCFVASNACILTSGHENQYLARTDWNGVCAIAKGAGRVGRTTAGLVTVAVGYVSPAGADWTLRVSNTIGDKVSGLGRSVDGAVRSAGELAWALAHTSLVRTAVPQTPVPTDQRT